MTNEMRLENINIVISGAAGLLGRQFAKDFMDQGARLLLLDNSHSSLENLNYELNAGYSGRFKSARCDITNESQIESEIKEFERQFGFLRAAVNNASINPKVEDNRSDFTQFELFPFEQWERDIHVGLTGALYLSRLTARSIIQNSSHGTILNIASHFSVIAPNQSHYELANTPANRQPKKPVSYSVVKHGLIGLTRYLAAYYAESNIRVNAVSPGGVFNNQPTEFLEKYVANVPLKRMATKEEISNAAIFLLSDESSYITGVNLLVDGGRTIW